MHHYPFHVGDYLLKTVHLPPMADLVYRRVLDLYYMEEAPIPNKPKWVATRIRLGDQEAMVLDVLRSFFVLDKRTDPHVWRNSRADKVISAYQKKAATARENGAQHLPGTKKEPKLVPTRLQPKPRTRTSKGVIPPTPQLGEWFDAWWAVYPLKVAKQDALKAWMQLLPDENLVGDLTAAIKRQVEAGHFTNFQGVSNPPYPASWLRARRWEDEAKPLTHAPRPAAQTTADRRAATIAGLTGRTPQGEPRETSPRPDAIDVPSRVVGDPAAEVGD